MPFATNLMIGHHSFEEPSERYAGIQQPAELHAGMYSTEIVPTQYLSCRGTRRTVAIRQVRVHEQSISEAKYPET